MVDAKCSGLNVLVTGAEGFIGSHVCEKLVRSGANVRALALYNSFANEGWLSDLEPDIRSQINLVFGDVRDPFQMKSIVDGQDVVLHLAALIAIPFSYTAPQAYVEVNVTGTLNMLEACRTSGVKRMVHTSTSEVYGTALFTPITEAHPLQAQSPYSASKIGADSMVVSYCRSFDFPGVILRPFNTFGPRQSERAIIPTVVRQLIDPACETIRVGDTSPIRDFNYVESIAEAFCLAAVSDRLDFGVPYNVGSGSAVTIEEMISIAQDIVGSGKPVVEDEKRRRPAKSEVFELLADASTFANATGWQSKPTFRDGLSATIDWWRVQIAENRHRSNQDYQI